MQWIELDGGTKDQTKYAKICIDAESHYSDCKQALWSWSFLTWGSRKGCVDRLLRLSASVSNNISIELNWTSDLAVCEPPSWATATFNNDVKLERESVTSSGSRSPVWVWFIWPDCKANNAEERDRCVDGASPECHSRTINLLPGQMRDGSSERKHSWVDEDTQKPAASLPTQTVPTPLIFPELCDLSASEQTAEHLKPDWDKNDHKWAE